MQVRPNPDLVARVMPDPENRRCMQCSTCSVVCTLSPAKDPFPRKEMLWARWGLEDQLLGDVDLWLCHQCNDCSTRCPRAARPGDVMAALRLEVIRSCAWPGILGRNLHRPGVLLGLALGAVLLFLGLGALGGTPAGGPIVFPYWPSLPHQTLFLVFGILAVFGATATLVGGVRFWKRLPALPDGAARGWGHSLVAAVTRALSHRDFCSSWPGRRLAHQLVVGGLCTLALGDLWVLGLRPHLVEGLAYPLSFWDPWKVLVNLSGLAILAGVGILAWVRLRAPGGARSTWADWLPILLLALIVTTGFCTEILHYTRWSGRWIVYVLHLCPTSLWMLSLPYTKFAHALYRFAALVHAERAGRLPAEERP